MLRNIANRLTNGPSPVYPVDPVGALPELDSSELESEMAELSRRKSETAVVLGDFGVGEENQRYEMQDSWRSGLAELAGGDVPSAPLVVLPGDLVREEN